MSSSASIQHREYGRVMEAKLERLVRTPPLETDCRALKGYGTSFGNHFLGKCAYFGEFYFTLIFISGVSLFALSHIGVAVETNARKVSF